MRSNLRICRTKLGFDSYYTIWFLGVCCLLWIGIQAGFSTPAVGGILLGMLALLFIAYADVWLRTEQAFQRRSFVRFGKAVVVAGLGTTIVSMYLSTEFVLRHATSPLLFVLAGILFWVAGTTESTGTISWRSTAASGYAVVGMNLLLLPPAVSGVPHIGMPWIPFLVAALIGNWHIAFKLAINANDYPVETDHGPRQPASPINKDTA